MELNKAISTLKSNQSPGPDGYSSQWNEAFKAELVPTLLRASNTTLTDAKMPPSWNEAVISIIPKEGNNKSECSSYRPASVLNVDYKLYASVLARRLDRVLPHLIHNDQTGFILQRQTHDNIRRSIHILHHIQKNNIEPCLVGVDAEKAFDSVSWPFLYKVLERFGLDYIFVRGIRTLYNKPSARIKINGNLSDTVTLEWGSRRGCPISPLLFALYIETPASWIRQTQNIEGICINGEDHKVARYADDVLVYLSNPSNSLPNLMAVLEKFGNYSGYKLNIQKTHILTINYQPTKQLREKFHINWDQKSLKYLGINLLRRIQTLAEINYGPLLTKIKDDVHRWNSISFLSLSHRIDSVRMNILPRYLYLFQALPVEVSPKQFSELDKIISRFIWQGKKPRVRFKTLQLPKEHGGMSLPNFKDYFFAGQIRPLIHLCNPSFQARWKDIEVSSEVDPPIQAALPHKQLGGLVDKVQNPWIKVQLKIWNMIKDEYKLNNKLQIIQWCVYDPEFKANVIDKGFTSWTSKGITTHYSLTEKGQLKSFDRLKEDCDLDTTAFFRFLQVRSRFEHIRKETDLDDPISNIFIDAYQRKSNKGVISRIYKGLMSKKSHNTDYVRRKWETEGNLLISEEDWLDVCRSQWKCSSSLSWREFSWKFMVGFFITPKQKAHFTGGEAACWRQCGHQEANHWQIFWECPVVESFWAELHKVLSGLFNTNLPLQFSTLFLGNADLQVTADEYLFDILITAGKKALTRRWLLPDPPTIQEWISIVNDVYLMERITSSLRLQKITFTKRWAKWVKYAGLEQTEVQNG